MKNIFGTDGARGIANTEITIELAMNIGKAVASILPTSKTGERNVIFIGKDTRISCDMLESAAAAGICSVGVDVALLGVVPSPAVSFLVKKYGASAGIMISASHNSFEFNGIKIFDSNGMKLSDEKEKDIEKILENGIKLNTVKNECVGQIANAKKIVQGYTDHVKNTAKNTFEGLKIAIDCSNGSASNTAKDIFESLGAQCSFIHCSSNGTNINANCGSTHPENLIEIVKKQRFDAGIAFDGDADRCLMIDELGNILDGDTIIAICAKKLKKEGELKGNTVVGTIVSNMGLINFCRDNYINFVETKVGDRYILEEISKNDFSIGGEQSGHVIFRKFANSGDGQLTAVQVLDLMKSENKPLSYFNSLVKKYPQTSLTVNIGTNHKGILYKSSFLNNFIENLKEETKHEGKIVVRESGTEPKIRILAEFLDENKSQKIANNIKNEIKNVLKIIQKI